MTKQGYQGLAEALGAQLSAANGKDYFRQHAERIWRCAEHFELFSRQHGDVLEVGPFYSYTPFALQDRATSYAVIEGIDPVVAPLLPEYQRRGIECLSLNLSDIFLARGGSQRLPLDSARFDTVICWETMEHFAFNPVAFVCELWRVMRPGGRAYLTVPNRASANGLLEVLVDKGAKRRIDAYFKFADYEASSGQPFLGFHWREYTGAEFSALFAGQGFTIVESTHLLSFMQRDLTASERLLRLVNQMICKVSKRLGNTVALTVSKPLET